MNVNLCYSPSTNPCLLFPCKYVTFSCFSEVDKTPFLLCSWMICEHYLFLTLGSFVASEFLNRYSELIFSNKVLGKGLVNKSAKFSSLLMWAYSMNPAAMLSLILW